jgi:hypothetical protein
MAAGSHLEKGKWALLVNKPIIIKKNRKNFIFSKTKKKCP